MDNFQECGYCGNELTTVLNPENSEWLSWCQTCETGMQIVFKPGDEPITIRSTFENGTRYFDHEGDIYYECTHKKVVQAEHEMPFYGTIINTEQHMRVFELRPQGVICNC